MEAGAIFGRKEKKKDVYRFFIDRLKVNPLYRPAEGTQHGSDALHFAVGDGNAFPDAGATQILPVQNDPGCQIGISNKALFLESPGQFSNHFFSRSTSQTNNKTRFSECVLYSHRLLPAVWMRP